MLLAGAARSGNSIETYRDLLNTLNSKTLDQNLAVKETQVGVIARQL